VSERTTAQETAAMLDRLRAFIASYVILPAGHYIDVVALWTVHTHAIGAFENSPRLILRSAEKESGKTRALEVLEVLTPAPLQTFNATIAAIFRLLREEQATLLIDECDAIFNPKAVKENEDLRALLNAGYRRGNTVARVVGEGKKMKVERFPVFAATALAAIGDLPDTIQSRGIIVPMRRRAPDEEVASFRRRYVNGAAEDLRGWLAQWGEEQTDVLAESEPAMPDGIVDRAADIWEPLLAVADLAGEEWAHRARTAAVRVVKGRVAEDQSIGVQLLAAIREAIGAGDRISSADLCARLNAVEEAGWGGWNAGAGINQRDLARRLKPYGVESIRIRLPDGSTPRGYMAADFRDPFARYLREGSATSATSATQIRIHVADVADVADTDGEPAGSPNGRAPIPLHKVDDAGRIAWRMYRPPGDLRCCAGLWKTVEAAAEHARSHGWEAVER